MQTKATMNTIEKLIEVRTTARRMHNSYLSKHNLLEYIYKETSEERFSSWNNRERIDYIVAGKPNDRCHCGNILKIGRINCSPKCTGNNPINVAKSSKIQTANASERLAKAKDTLMEKYGVPHNNHIPACREARRLKRLDWSERTFIQTFKNYGLDIENFRDKESLQKIIDSCVSLSQLSENHFGGMPLTTVQRHCMKYDTKLYPKSSSGAERELAEFIESLGVEISTGNRILIKPLEVDIVVHEKKIAIEFDGIYWHSAARAEKNHLLDKTISVESKGYQLIHVFEHEWSFYKEILKSVIASKLGIYSEKHYARKCEVKQIPSEIGIEFFKRTHIQASSAASIYVGLFHGDRLVMCCSFGKPRFSKESDYELIRFSSELNTSITGGFSKILKFFKTNYPGTILTYCDRRFSVGKTYSQFGEYLRSTPPNYTWCHGSKLTLSRYQTQKKKLKTLFPDIYRDDLTEDAIMMKKQYHKMYDCGHHVYML
jgi:very-short-patch-repair endonuclease